MSFKFESPSSLITTIDCPDIEQPGISATVVDSNGSLISDATVQIKFDEVLTTLNQQSGQYIGGSHVGAHEVFIFRNGYIPMKGNVTIAQNKCGLETVYFEARMRNNPCFELTEELCSQNATCETISGPSLCEDSSCTTDIVFLTCQTIEVDSISGSD